MKFLITCYRLDLSGSSTYTFTLASELKKKGHKVDILSPFPEIIADKLKEKNISVFENLEKIIDKEYDCIIAQHNILALIVRGLKPAIPMIYVSHGILPLLEQPPSININIQKYIVVSEEVKNNLIINYYIPPHKIEIVRNFIDTERFFSQKEINEEPKAVLIISNKYTPKIYKVIKMACSKLRLKLMVIGKHKQVFETEKYINKADLVISLGRGVLEAMACGRAVIVYDYQGGDGMVTKNNINEIRKNNFSGRRFKKDYDVATLIQEIRRYKKPMGDINRKIILKDYNASLAIEKIIGICTQAIADFCSQELTSIPSPELIFLQNQFKNMYNHRLYKIARKIKNILLRRF
jgi:glycosyltransferase involved in cell wall biosynthesis